MLTEYKFNAGRDMARTFFTADTHFGQQRTLDLSRRPFTDVEEMDNAIIRNWNHLVQPHDTIYHLGDFGDRPEVIEQLQGIIIFLPGNYDTPEILEELSHHCRIIEPNTVVTRDGHHLQLIHEPEEAVAHSSEPFFLFGHIHKLQMVKRNGLNVGTDCHLFAPIALDDVLFYKEAILRHYDENVFIEHLGSNHSGKPE
jgi:calcineurin-like phosphoesterase family protein